MNSHVKLNSKEWNECCTIIDALEDLGEDSILAQCVRMLCANSEECMDLVIINYSDVLEQED